MKKTNLLQWLLLIATVASNNQFIHAQVVYTDVSPDKTYKCSKKQCTQTYSLDLNNDGIIDFNLLVNGKPSVKTSREYDYSVSLVALNSNSVSVYDVSNPLPLALPNGATVGSGLTWASSSLRPLRSNSNFCFDGCAPYCDGLWSSSSDSYLGLKIITGNETNYGWARLSVDVPCGAKFQSASFTIKDYAYNKTPDQPIISGNTSGAVTSKNKIGEPSNEVSEKYKIDVYPNPSSQSTTISFSIAQSSKVSLKIFDLSGRLVTTLSDNEMQAGNHELKWNGKNQSGSNVSAGIYFLRIEIENDSEMRKILIIE